jgi:YHS domain-containing protein
MRSISLTLTCVVALGMVSNKAFADEEVNLKGVKCVVNGEAEAQATSSAEYQGGKVYFCCNGCLGNFHKDSKKFAAAANFQLVATKQYKQVQCPLMAKDVKPGVVVKVGTVEVGFCCPGCQKKVAGLEGKEQLEAVFAEPTFKKGFVPSKRADES